MVGLSLLEFVMSLKQHGRGGGTGETGEESAALCVRGEGAASDCLQAVDFRCYFITYTVT